ncbi:transcriptional regulator [Virgibacillus soli]|uniref:helix-turn-helix domain-containing protein n=1 Tax=Lederbergia galactosidilytica TaxID=217031 RepID=UPI00071424D3|nr:helix-turn-helix domain-containing protein [Lederbergia galactosidilytica]KRG08914.1 transcriptional regulator [Virgibacillus soli]MBP1916158.1 YesN/AraC family two-component response regulator [Lederbergia galactosidilytica]
MKIRTFKHFYKLVTLLIILGTVPVIIVGIFSYWKSSQVIEDHSAQEKIQNVYQIQTNVEQVLKNIDHSVTYFLNSPQTKEIIRYPLSADNFKKYHDIRPELNHLQTVDTGIEDIVLVSLKNDWLINNNGLTYIDEEEKEAILSNYMNLPESSTWIQEEYEEISLNNDAKKSCSHYISLVKKLPFTSAKKTAVASVLVPSCSLTKIMEKKVDSEIYMILDSNNQIIAHSDSDEIGETFKNSQEILADINQEAGQFNRSIDGIDYKVTYQTSRYNHWSYLSLIKMSDLNKQSSSIGWLTFLVCSVLLILSLIISFIGSQRIYQPIRKLHKLASDKFSTKDNQGYSHKNEFDLIETHIEQLLDKNVELEGRLQSQVTQLKQFFMIRLLQGKVHKQEITNKLVSYNYPKSWKHLTLFTLEIDGLDQTKYKESDQDLLLFAINNMIEDLFPTDQCFTPVVINHTLVMILLDHFDSMEEYTHYMNEQAQLIQTEIKAVFDLPVSIGISHPFQSLSTAKEAFKEGKEALKYRFKSGAESIIFFENINQNYQLTTPFPTVIKNHLFDAIKVADREKAEQEFDRFFQVLSQKNFHHNHFYIIMTRLLYELIELMQILGIQIKGLDEREFFTEIEHLGTLKEVKRWFKQQIIYPLIDKVEERTESENKSLSDKIIHIIHHEFDTDISLDSIATRLHYNPNYLSSIFQKEMNVSFSEYLIMYRINMAKQWLVNTDISVKDIATKLHYNNSQNFIRSFRKMEGITPGKYRSQHKQAI